MLISQLLSQLNLSDNESKVFLGLRKAGDKPASQLSKFINMERTLVYKICNRLIDLGLVIKTSRRGVVHFVIPSSDILRTKLEEQKNSIDQLYNQRNLIEDQLNQDRKDGQIQAPKISIFDTRDSLTQCVEDILLMIDQHKYLSIKFFASNTFESTSTTGFSLQDYTKHLRTKLKNKKVQTDIYLGSGTLIMEQLNHTSSISNIMSLPAGSNAVNIFIVGQYMYFIIYHNTPIAIKIQSQQLADTMHFVFEQTKKASL